MTPAYPAWIEVDLSALVHNAGVLRRAIPPSTRLGVLVKANGYGHGLEMAARAALKGGVDQLIVAVVEEGLALRAAGIDAPVLVGYPPPAEAVVHAARAGLELSVGNTDSIRRTLDAWRASGHPATELALHVEVDTGMGRGGVLPNGLSEVVAAIDSTPGAQLAGVWTHLADGRDGVASGRQAAIFESALANLAATGRSIPPRHIVATEGLFADAAPAWDFVRIGLAFYGEIGVGFDPAPALAGLAEELRPAMSVKARAIRIERMAAGSTVGYGSEWVAGRESVVATLPIGYADGWARGYWPGAMALVRGSRVPLVGRVSMDSVCVDITDVAAAADVRPEEEFVLLGIQGEERITANDLAKLRGTITHEVLATFGGRLPRLYIEDGRPVAISRPGERLERLV